MQEIKVNITGKVQMVMFRDYVRRRALKLELKGSVRNLDNGAVEVIAQGEKDDLEKLIEILHKGPLLANVIRVHVEWTEPISVFDSFTIEY